MATFHASFTSIGTLTATFVEAPTFGTKFENTVVPEFEYYDGPVDIVPTNYAQRIGAAGKCFASDITIQPIPSNYGLITWDGAKLTVS